MFILFQHRKIDTKNSNKPNISISTQLGKEKIADMLIGHKADVNYKDEQGETPLHWAAQFGKLLWTHKNQNQKH